MRPQRYVNPKRLLHGTTIAILAIVVFIFHTSCNENSRSVAPAMENSDSLALMSTYDVKTLISDSGRISYSIDAAEWLVFNKRNPPYWAFEKGVYLEKYDRDKNIEATIKCDTAYYFNEMKLWKLIGNVDIRNQKNERFFTDLLYWNQEEKTIYSDAYIKIEQEDQVTEGIGFSSNQDLSSWHIKNTKGIYTIKDK